MKLQQYLLNHYLHIPYEDFSHRAVMALGILTTIKFNTLSEPSAEQLKSLGTSIARIEEIIKSTDKNLEVSLFILDRNISPQDFSKTAITHIIKFTRRKAVNDKTTISLDSNEIQKWLCTATMEINQILMEQIAVFSDQIMFDNAEL